MDNIDEKMKLKKEYIKNQVLSEDVKNNIIQAMKKEYEKKEKIHSNKLYKKVIGVVACLLIISSVTFAGNIGDFFTNIFKNTEMNKDQVINPNSIIEINSEYVTCDGIGLNVAYMYEDDEYLYAVMNVKGVDNLIDITINKMTINDIKNNISYDDINLISKENNHWWSAQYKNDSKIIFIKIEKNENLDSIKELELKINNLTLKRETNKFNDIIGEWIFKIENPSVN